MTNQEALFEYTLRLADNALILGHRLSEWCGHGPILEQDMAITNIALDFVGQSRSLYQYAAKIEDQGRTEDDLAYLREVYEYKNLLILEEPNGGFGNTIVRQFLHDVYNFYFYQTLADSKDEQLAAVAVKSLKEITYHLRFSSEWMLRLGDGTELSHQKMQTALDNLWDFAGEFFIMDKVDETMIAAGVGVDLNVVKALWEAKVAAVLSEATLVQPESKAWTRRGGKQGVHSEQMGYLLAELQYLQRVHPGAEW
ncbi:MAG: ring-1,2-phenylacetyl-CoA epoxidase subunit PaaC [Polaribacter sp.]|jgi:ring-1,2-phenylacetyl-CoA epoxidase subunit PaaC